LSLCDLRDEVALPHVGEHRLLASQLLALYFTWIKLLKTLISLVLLKQAVFPKWKEEPIIE